MNENPNEPVGGALAAQSQPASKTGAEATDFTLRDFVNKVPETINRAIERALNVRDTTVVVRLSEPISEALDTLVTAGIFKGRAEAAAFLIGEGVKAQSPLFGRIQAKLAEIERLRDELRHTVSPEIRE
jgi:hypothetical protein